MTALVPAADSAASQQAVVDAALLLLGQMGLSPEDLLVVPRERPVLSTFAEYVPVVSAEPDHRPRHGPGPGRLGTGTDQTVGSRRRTGTGPRAGRARRRFSSAAV